MIPKIVTLLVAAVSLGMSETDRNLEIGINHVNPKGIMVSGNVNVPVYKGMDDQLDVKVHGSRVSGGPYHGDQSVGGGLQYQHNSGLHGGVDVTHHRGAGKSYSATVGGQTSVGPGTLSVDAGAARHPGSSKVQGQLGATLTIPF